MIHAWWALTVNGFREARRNRVTLAIGFFAAGLVLTSALATEVTVYTLDRVLTDVGLGAMSIMLAILAIFLSCSQLSRDIERRTIFIVASKPISRGLYLVGRYSGTVLTLTVMVIAMALLFAGQSYFAGFPFTLPQLTAIFGLWLELVLLVALGFLLSSFSSQIFSALVLTCTYFAGHLSPDVYSIAEKSKNGALRSLGLAAYYGLPNLERLNFRGRASYEMPSSPGEVLQAALYGVCYTAVAVSLGVLIFRRRDFK